MKITNRKSTARLKRIFFLVSVVIAIAALMLFWFDLTIYALIMIGVFSLWFLFFLVADYQYIEYIDENDKIILRYYKAVGFTQKEFSSIEFPVALLKDAQFENSIFGKLSDLTLIVKTKRGVAEYPSISLSAVPYKNRKQIQQSLQSLLDM
ncbi:hypothetical protein [uncultured Draconibacterium sp.]|uniref:hypothetical protein n=1 Tax=uncultured Draconibacterium sp. TaxID=1573823 RepID=UPI0032178F57